MASIPQLQRQFIEYTTSLYSEGYLNDQFMRLQKLQVEDENEPEFLVGLVSVFLEQSEKLLNILETAFQQKTVDYEQVAAHVHKFKGGSTSVGAERVTSVCLAFLNYCKEKNRDGCLWCLQQVNHECILVRNKLEALFRLEQKILQAGGSIPLVE